MYTKLQKLQLAVKLHTPNYTILLYIMPNYISYLKLGHYTITPKFSNYANYNNLHQLHQTTPTHLTTATTVTKPNNLKLQQCTPTAPNYTTLYELHQTRKEPQQTTPITRTTSATPVYINYTYYTVE